MVWESDLELGWSNILAYVLLGLRRYMRILTKIWWPAFSEGQTHGVFHFLSEWMYRTESNEEFLIKETFIGRPFFSYFLIFFFIRRISYTNEWETTKKLHMTDIYPSKLHPSIPTALHKCTHGAFSNAEIQVLNHFVVVWAAQLMTMAECWIDTFECLCVCVLYAVCENFQHRKHSIFVTIE